ncbi:MAG: transcriptional regulator PpsR [Caldimonas sp.]
MKPPSAGEPPDLAALSEWAPELARTFVALATDIALVIDDSGVIRTVEQSGQSDPMVPSAHGWVGRQWVDTVSSDTRTKIQNLLSEAATNGIARRREVNHALQPGSTLPVAYTAIRLGANGPVLAVGRDLRAVAAIQQRFIESQQDLERGYWKARQAESRYRVLFQVATDAVLVVDPETLLILETNQAASRLFGETNGDLTGRPATTGFALPARAAVNELLATARTNGQTGEISARLLGMQGNARVVATSFRAEDAMRLLVRVRVADASTAHPERSQTLARLVDTTRDAVVVSDSSGRVLFANAAFVELVRAGGEAEIQGRPLADWLETPGRTLADTVMGVRREGVIRRIGATARRGAAAPLAVELSASLLTEGDQECIGFTLHPQAAANASSVASAEPWHDALDALSAQLGVQPLSSLLSGTAALAERHFIQLALQRTGGNAAKAALLLGIGRDRIDPALRDDPTASDASH